MAKRQTRRALSVKGLTYQRLRKWCKANDKTAGGTVEILVNKFLDAQGAPEETVLNVTYPKPRENDDDGHGGHFTF